MRHTCHAPHTVRFVTVDHDVRLEVLDFGGGQSTAQSGGRSGDENRSRPIVLLTGLGDNAHVFDTFAPKLTASHHVYAITRRGFGASSAPADGYSSDRLGDDVLEVLQALKISRPILIGHSVAGAELSSIGTRHPELVAGLVYLEAGYRYALYSGGDLDFDIDELRRKLDALQRGDTAVVGQLLTTDLPRVTQDLQRLQNMPHVPPGTPFIDVATGQPLPPLLQLIAAGLRKYGPVTAVPILAIFAPPPNPPPLPGPDPAAHAEAATQARMAADIEQQQLAFEQAMPAAHVVRIPHADHWTILRANEADVLREINAFLAGLPPAP